MLFKISGMHCTSCAMSIDGELEDAGVTKANTNYAKSITEVIFDTDALTHHEIVTIIEKVGYKAQLVEK